MIGYSSDESHPKPKKMRAKFLQPEQLLKWNAYVYMTMKPEPKSNEIVFTQLLAETMMLLKFESPARYLCMGS